MNCTATSTITLDTSRGYVELDSSVFDWQPINKNMQEILFREAAAVFDDFTSDEIFIILEMAKTFKNSMETKNLQITEK